MLPSGLFPHGKIWQNYKKSSIRHNIDHAISYHYGPLSGFILWYNPWSFSPVKVIDRKYTDPPTLSQPLNAVSTLSSKQKSMKKFHITSNCNTRAYTRPNKTGMKKIAEKFAGFVKTY